MSLLVDTSVRIFARCLWVVRLLCAQFCYNLVQKMKHIASLPNGFVCSHACSTLMRRFDYSCAQ